MLYFSKQNDVDDDDDDVDDDEDDDDDDDDVGLNIKRFKQFSAGRF